MSKLPINRTSSQTIHDMDKARHSSMFFISPQKSSHAALNSSSKKASTPFGIQPPQSHHLYQTQPKMAEQPAPLQAVQVQYPTVTQDGETLSIQTDPHFNKHRLMSDRSHQPTRQRGPSLLDNRSKASFITTKLSEKRFGNTTNCPSAGQGNFPKVKRLQTSSTFSQMTVKSNHTTRQFKHFTHQQPQTAEQHLEALERAETKKVPIHVGHSQSQSFLPITLVNHPLFQNAGMFLVDPATMAPASG